MAVTIKLGQATGLAEALQAASAPVDSSAMLRDAVKKKGVLMFASHTTLC